MESKIRTAKTPHAHQSRDIEKIFGIIAQSPPSYRLLYQLPTGGGKTLVFSEIARKFLEVYKSRVMILTHRKELCTQTTSALKRIGLSATTIKSGQKGKPLKSDCVVAMVETLHNRLQEDKKIVKDVGLLIIDEAHHNSFRKLLSSFGDAFVIGVTATPFSSDVSVPMKKSYDSLVVGEDIQALIDNGLLAKPRAYAYEIELTTLKKGVHGDYTVASSNELYGMPVMLNLLHESYYEHAKGKKTLIFNNGIETSLQVKEVFERAGVAIKHLDNKTPDGQRKEILEWFRKKKDAVLTSVSILTTGFDEPSIQAVILNRATTSITLYHQMIGRASRILASKKTFTIVDLGNNIERFGEWQKPLDWSFVFEHPDAFAESLHFSGASSTGHSHAITAEMRARFPNTLEMTFDIEGNYEDVIAHGLKPKRVIQQSLRQHALMCVENAASVSQALELADVLSPEIDWRTKEYTRCIEKATKSYRQWLAEDYKDRLKRFITKLYHLKENAATSA